MKRLFLLSALAALSAFAGNLTETTSQDPKAVQSTMLSFALPNGETTVDLRYPLSLERLEGAFLTGSKTLKVERIRDLHGIPYIDHRTNDGEVVNWEVTDGTTYDNYDEAFSGPLVTYSDYEPVYHTDKPTTSPVYSVSVSGNDSTVKWYRGYHTVDGTSGYGPEIYYSFADNAMFLAKVYQRKDLWTSLGPKARFSIYQGTVRRPDDSWYSGNTILEKVLEGTPTFDTSTADVSNLVVTNLFEEDDGPISHFYNRWGVDPDASWEGTNLIIDIVTAYDEYYITNDISRFAWSETPTSTSYGAGIVPSTNSFVTTTSYGTVTVTTNKILTVINPMTGTDTKAKGYHGNGFMLLRTTYGLKSVTENVTERKVSEVIPHFMNDLPSMNRYSSVLFAGVTMPTNLVGATDGTTVPVSFVPGHTITNFAVWSTCSMCVTNTLLNATVGTSFSTNFNGDAILLPKDRIRISGTAMPTGHIIGIGKK